MNRTKVTVACQACQKKKVKCTGSSPCTNCSRSGNACIFSNTAKKRGPRNGNVEVIKSSAHRIENVLLNYPSLRDQIEQMLERNSNKNGNHHNKRSQSRSLHSMRLGLSSQKNHVLDDDKHNGRVSSFPYPVSKKSLSHHDDVIIKPQRRQDQVDRQENHPSPIFCRPLPVYPSNMQRNHASTDDFSSQRSDIHRYAQAGPPTSHSNTSEVVVSSTTNPLLPPFAKMETSSIQMKDQKPDDENHLTLPVPHSLLLKRKPTSSVYNTSLGTPLLLPAPDLENPLDALHKSLISNSSLHQQEGLLPQNNHNDSLESKIILADWNEMINDNEKKSVTCTKISLPSPPSYISLSSSPRSTCTNYPPTPTSSVSPPLSPPTKSIPINSFTSKRSSIHLLSKPAPWCANVVSEDRINRSHNELMEMNGSC